MNELRVGVFALVTIAAIVYMSLKITSNQSGFGEYVKFRTIVEDASGIFPKTPIKVAGITAGRIKDIELQGNRALISFEVLKKVNVPKGSKLRIKTVGFLGDKYLEIFVSENKELMEENSLIESEQSGGVEQLAKNAADLLVEIKEVVVAVKEAVAPPGKPSPLKMILADMQTMMFNAKEATISIRNIISGNEDKLNNIVANLDKFTEQLAYELDRAEKGNAISDLDQIMANAKKITGDLQALISDIRSGKGTAGQILVEDKIADDVKQTLASVQKIVGKVDVIRTELEAFTGADTRNGGYTSGNLKIYPSPERFYTFGVTTSKLGPEKEKTTTTVTNGVTTEEYKKERDKNSYVFNAQLGRKIHDWSFRGGLIESTGGVGVDYDFTRLGTRLSGEVFDYRTDVGVNFRLTAEAHIWNVFYGKISGDDLAQNKTRSMSVGAGLRFNDEDLKGLLGFMF